MAREEHNPHPADTDGTHDSRYYREEEVDSLVAAAGVVSSVNTQTGIVVIDADDIDDTTTVRKFTTAAGITKLTGIEALADVTDAANVNPSLTDAGINSAATTINSRIARTDPGASSTIIGQSSRYGPNGPTWTKDAVSADWYSNINDAISAAGQGGTVRLSPNTNYTQPTPAQLIPGITIEGDRKTSRINVTDTGLKVMTPTSLCDRVILRNFTLSGSGGALVGLDARGLTRSVFEGIDISGFTTAEAWFGGASPAYYASWTNRWTGGQLSAPTNGAGLLLSGTTGTGAVTANNITFHDLVIFVANAATSIGIDAVEGDTNLFMHCDVGYSGGAGVPFRLGGKALNNTFLANRTEDIDTVVQVLSGAGYNTFISNTLGSKSTTLSPVELFTGSQFSSFIANTYSSTAPSPRVKINSGATNTTVLDNTTDPQVKPLSFKANGTGDKVIGVKVATDVNDRFLVNAAGGLIWADPVTGAAQIYLRPSSQAGGVLGLDDNRFWQLPRHAVIPAATATRRGSQVRLEGAAGVRDSVYTCIKNAADTYEWVQVADAAHTHTLDSLSDVVITTPTSGQVVKYDGTQWINGTDATSSGGIGGAAQLNELSDVTITAAATGELLRYDGAQWVDTVLVAGDIPSHTQSADTLTDGTTNKAFLATERTKLTGIAAGAQVNTVDSVAAKTGAVTLVKGDVGLGSVDNTTDAAKPVSTAQQAALNLKSNTNHGHTITVGIPLVLDGGGVALTTGVKLSGVEIPFAATIIGWVLFTDTNGGIVCTVSKSTYANFPTFTDISGTEKPTVSSTNTKSGDTSLTTWTTAVAGGDLLQVSIDSVATITRATLNLRMTRTV